MKEIIRLRALSGADVLETINRAYIAERFFNRSRAWFTQRLNNNLVNGKPASFTPDELLRLRTALKIIASEITKFTTQIPNLPTDMSIKIHVVTDPTLIDFIIDNDIDGFKAYLQETKEKEEFILFDEPERFDTEAEAIAFCSGLGHGKDERATPDHYPLRSSEPDDLPFIEAIEEY